MTTNTADPTSNPTTSPGISPAHHVVDNLAASDLSSAHAAARTPMRAGERTAPQRPRSTRHIDVEVHQRSASTTLGQRIAALRRAAGLSQQGLAGSSGAVSVSMISLIEADKRNPSPEVLDHIAVQLGVHVDQLRPTVGASAAAPTGASRAIAWRVTIRTTVPSHGTAVLALPEQTHDVVATSARQALQQVSQRLR